MRPRAVVFDVLGTLVHDPFEEEMAAFFGMSREEFLQALRPGVWPRFERGEIGEEDFVRSMFRDGRAFDLPAFKAMLQGAWRWLDGMKALVRALAGTGLPLHLCSNYPVWYRDLESCLRLSRWLRWTFVSCEHRMRKPDPAVFERTARLARLPPEALLFVDDRTGNCEAARRMGFQALPFAGAPALARELARLGLLSSDSLPQG